MKLQEIAEKCAYEFCGQNRDVSTISFASCASENSIAIAASKKEILETKAICVLTKPTLIKTDKSLLFVDDEIEMATVKVANVLIENGVVKQYGIPQYNRVSGYYVGKNVSASENVKIAPNVYIGDDVSIGKNVVIEPNVFIGGGSVIADNVYIAAGSAIGANSFYHYSENSELKDFFGIGRAEIESDVHIGYNTVIQRGTFSNTVIGSGCKIGNCVEIGHDVRIGKNCKITSQSAIAGNAVLGDYVTVYGQVGIANGVEIGDFVTVMAKSGVTKKIKNHATVSGLYARNHVEELLLLSKLRKL